MCFVVLGVFFVLMVFGWCLNVVVLFLMNLKSGLKSF